MSLSALLEDPTKRDAIIADAMNEVDAEVAGIGGIKGKAIGAGYQGVQKLRPGFLQSNLERLLPKFAPALDPHVETGRASGDLPGHFTANADTIADEMLAVTDERAASSNNKSAASIYNKLRKGAKDRVVAAMPRIGAFVDRHATS